MKATSLSHPPIFPDFWVVGIKLPSDFAAAHKALHKPKLNDPYAAILVRHGADHEHTLCCVAPGRWLALHQCHAFE